MLHLLRQAFERRKAMSLGDADAFRVIDGAADGWPEVTVDKFGDHWLCSATRFCRPEEQAVLEAAVREGLCQSVWWKLLDRDQKSPPVALVGQEEGRPFSVRENGLSFEIDFSAGYSPGIFLDQRDNRRLVRERTSRGDRVLNCFSYTCAFSVAAAAAGGISTSLDLSANYLDWGKRNFALNGMDASSHYFCRGDSLEWMRRFAKQGRQFQGVILDPPTFSRGPSGVFRAQKDFTHLVFAANAILAPNGWMLCSSNDRHLEWEPFERMVARATDKPIRPLRMPPDFRGDPYLKCFWVGHP